MVSKVLKTIKILIAILVIRYIGLFVFINNMPLLYSMSFCNPLINARPIIVYIPPLAEFFPKLCQPPLIYAIDSYNYNAVRVLLKTGANPNIRTTFSNSLPIEDCLHYGSENRFKIVKLLLDYGGRYNDSNIYLVKLLCKDGYLINNDRYDLFMRWMKENDFRNYEDGYYNYYNLITNAIYGNSYQELRYIFNNYELDVNYIDKEFKYSYLETAIRYKRVEIFKLLIDNGANVNYVNSNNNTLDDIITIEVEDYDVKNEMLKILKEAREKK